MRTRTRTRAQAHARQPVPPSRFRHRDAWRAALGGVGSRLARSALSALGITVSIAALTVITGLSATNQASLLADLDSQGANLIVASAAPGAGDRPRFLPATAPAMAGRLPGVRGVAVVSAVPPDVYAYLNDLVPSGQTNGLAVRAVAPEYVAAVGATLSAGRTFDEAARALPVTVLGSEAARLLGVVGVGQRLWIGGEWYSVTGILQPRPLVAELDGSVLLGDRWSEEHLWAARAPGLPADDPGHVVSLTVRADADLLADVRRVLARTVDPAHPGDVSVSPASQLARSRATVDDNLSSLVLALAAVALLVGAIGIANTMVVAVIERRSEIGLRRALGARPSHIARQFLLEGMILSGCGGVAGWVLGALAVSVFAIRAGEAPVLPAAGVVLYPAIAVLVGALSGLHPALRAARVPPTVALRAG